MKLVSYFRGEAFQRGQQQLGIARMLDSLGDDQCHQRQPECRGGGVQHDGDPARRDAPSGFAPDDRVRLHVDSIAVTNSQCNRDAAEQEDAACGPSGLCPEELTLPRAKVPSTLRFDRFAQAKHLTREIDDWQ